MRAIESLITQLESVGSHDIVAPGPVPATGADRVGRPFEVEELAAGRLRSEARSVALSFRVREPSAARTSQSR